MRINAKATLITSAIIASLTLTACNPSETETTAQDGTTTTEQEGTTTSEQADPQEKLNAYIDCSNGTITDLHDSFERYSQWAGDAQTGPADETSVHGLYEINEHGLKACVDNASAAVNMSPSLPKLDEAAVAYIAAIKEYDDVSRKANKYYDQGNYKDDDFVLGRELHPQLVSTYQAAEKAAEEFGSQVDQLNTKMQNEQLIALEQSEGRKFNYLALANTINAKNLVDYIAEEDFDAQKAQELIEAYEASATELDNYIDTEADDLPTTVVTIETPMEELLVASKERMRRVRDNQEYDQFEIGQLNSGAGWVVEGSPHKVIRAYNNFIDKMNLMTNH